VYCSWELVEMKLSHNTNEKPNKTYAYSVIDTGNHSLIEESKKKCLLTKLPKLIISSPILYFFLK
jgi:hypothetical protein